ncbi:hypothetical protein BGX34_011266 [Mortierella sp. NVP85]|nr:hypothetical protein BGX34_011266 [Mortierella sp. NVP85]
MAMTERHAVNSYFPTTHARVDSDDLAFSSLQRPISSGGLRRCAATRDLTSIGSDVNYIAKVHVEYVLGDASPTFQVSSWTYLATPKESCQGVVVDNLETVRRFKETLYTQLCPEAVEAPGDCWPRLSLFRRIDHEGFEPIDVDHEALYTFALKDGDRVVLVVHENNGSSEQTVNPVAQWVEAIRAQTEFEAIDV